MKLEVGKQMQSSSDRVKDRPRARRRTWHEVWSCDAGGQPHRHGAALGRTFEDACKQLACDSMDFWTHFDKMTYRGRRLCPSCEEAVAGHAATGT